MKKREGEHSSHEVDVEGAVPDYKYMCNKPESEFLLVKLGTFGLVNIWGPVWTVCLRRRGPYLILESI